MSRFIAALAIAGLCLCGCGGGESTARGPASAPLARQVASATVSPAVEIDTQVAQLYVAMFGRAPDAQGLNFWGGLLRSGRSFTSIADDMFGVAPARAYFPTGSSNTQIVTSFYTNVLGRAPDAGGLAYWLTKFDAPGATPGTVIAQLVSVVATYGGTDPAGLQSAALFNNRATVAQFYGEVGGAIAGATAAIAPVTADVATVQSTEVAITASLPAGATNPVFNPFQLSMERQKAGNTTPVTVRPAANRAAGVDPFAAFLASGASN